MKRIFTSLTLGLLVCASVVQAQYQPKSDRKVKPNLSSARFLVNAPASQAGLKSITLASWAGQLPVPLLNAPVAKGLDSLAMNPLTNGAAVSGKVCLLFRGGGVTFAQKVQYAQNAGAIGVIIVNNIPGEPVAMGNTGSGIYTIPAVMVSDVVGIALNNSLLASVPVNVSIGAWGLGATHDLAILPGYQSNPHAMNIPLSQLSKGASRLPYQNFVAGAIINYGSSAESNINVADSVVWNPSSGAPSTVHQSSYNVASIPANSDATDSVRFGFGNSSSNYSLPAPSTTGYFTYNYRMTYPNTDQFPEDNTYSYKQYVTDSIFCKGNYNYTTNAPNVTLSIQPASAADPFCLGPLYYVADDSFAARKLQFTITMNGATNLQGSEAYALVYKWTDGSVGQPLDSFIEAAELKLVGLTYKAFTATDLSGDPVTLQIRDAVTPSKTVVLDSNSWYWTPAQATFDAFIGVDETVSPFTRAYEQSQVFNYQEHLEALFNSAHTDINATNTNAVATWPFGGHGLLVDSTFFDRMYYVPAIALHISKNKIAKPERVETTHELGDVNVYPVPANNFITVDAKLAKNFTNVGYRLLDIGGRVVYKADKNNVQNEKFNIPTSNIAPGIYHLLVIADGDITTRQVVIKH